MQKISKVLFDDFYHPLIHLNLASNCLYDEGIQYVAKILRINRKIISLNMTDNKIRSEGLQNLLEPLIKFQLRQEEIVIRRRIKFNYYKKTVSFKD